jgi:hypothetical protein
MRTWMAIAVWAAMAQGAPLRVLFIGNSLTAANDLPAMVEALAKANGEAIVTRMVAIPNYSLEDHWNRGDAKRAIAEGGWSFVVLQQGPSALPESRVLLVEYARRFAAETAKIHARTALFMVWPASSRAFDFDGVRLSYEAAAREVGGVFLAAGEAWRTAWRSDAKLEFYGTDGFHPTKLGSYLAAVVVYQGLTGKTAMRSAGGLATESEWRVLQQAAARAGR